jgi:ATP-dependent Lon protease
MRTLRTRDAKNIPFPDEEVEIEEDEVEEKEQAHWYGFEEDVEDVAIADTLPILPLRGVVVFPAAIVPLLISRESSLALVDRRSSEIASSDWWRRNHPEQDSPAPEDLFRRGSAGRILKMLKYPDGSYPHPGAGPEAHRGSRLHADRAVLDGRASPISTTCTRKASRCRR